MVNPQGTSFIPQRPSHGKAAPRKVRKVYILAYLSFVLFFGSLISAGAVFFFNFSLNLQIEQQQQVLAAERDKFNQGDIESVRDLERRINLAEERLNHHVSVLSILEALETSAVQSLYFVSFNYVRAGDQFPTITFAGNSDRFDNVLFQREVLASNPILAGSAFKEVSMQTTVDSDTGATSREVMFTLEKEVDTSLIGYTPRSNFSSGGTQQVPEATEEQITEEDVSEAVILEEVQSGESQQ